MAAVGAKESVAEDYRLALRNLAAAVAVVTTFDAAGLPQGTTVSAFTPLSMDPPLLLVSLENSSRLLAHMRQSAVLGVNLLSSEQADLGSRFAQREEERWEGVPWERKAGAPALLERHAYIAGTVREMIEAGDHTLVIGTVRMADWGWGEPLTYWQRGFGTHRDL